ncbi:MAG TPA: beta-propeller fold lactonase family protein [Kofleriaceae bacterium]|nr:beta-propeller fold lactonase family protein [Kofleriaceae bacterium]
MDETEPTVAEATTTSAITNPTSGPAYRLFESGQVRPLALSADKKLLFAANTPDNRLEIFYAGDGELRLIGSVTVGMEPVAVAVRSWREVWVVNHLSDSVSIVDVSIPTLPRVTRTLLVGDEPRDIVFAGTNRDRAFVTTAHRGQNSPIDPQLTTPGIGRADVWVFDTRALGSSLGGTPQTIVSLFTDSPRALAVSPDGSRVYAAGFMTGNKTAVAPVLVTLQPGAEPFGMPPPFTDSAGVPAPPVSLVVKHDGEHWRDAIGRIWDRAVNFTLPDKDVFVIDANANPPAQLAGSAGFYRSVGNVLFNMAVNPVSGKVYVSNTDANNLTRFEGPGVFGGSTVRGNLAQSRITVLDGSGNVTPRHLNKHINYAACCDAPGNAEARKSLAFPNEMVVSRDGAQLYVAAFGSSKIGVFDTAQLEADTFTPSEDAQIEVSGGGPAGLVADEARHRLYTLTRFDNSISVIDTAAKAEVDHVAMFNPEPATVVNGRRFLYDALHTSSHGDSACASCHINGDFDSIGWDLGNPDETTLNNPGPFTVPVPDGAFKDFHSMKGLMITQSLRGMANHGPMHWRGDRTGGNDEPTAQPDSGTFNEDLAFKKFNVAFPGLLGRDEQLTAAEMDAFTKFILQLSYPPNPIRNLDNSLTSDQQMGRDMFFTRHADGIRTCEGCHKLDPNANAEYGVQFPGFFGTDGQYSVEPEPQFFKVPHLRNMYQKVGMFGMVPSPLTVGTDTSFTGDQIRGFGFIHDGQFDTPFRFLSNLGFLHSDVPTPFGFGIPQPEGFSLTDGGLERRQVESFVFAFDSNLKPIVGQQITLRYDNQTVAGPRIDLLKARATAGDCDLVAKTHVGLHERGFLYKNGMFIPDRAGAPAQTDEVLRWYARWPGAETTYTCVAPGEGVRVAIDRDLDGILDRDEAGYFVGDDD